MDIEKIITLLKKMEMTLIILTINKKLISYRMKVVTEVYCITIQPAPAPPCNARFAGLRGRHLRVVRPHAHHAGADSRGPVVQAEP